MTPLDRRRRVVVAGHRGELEVVMKHLADDDPGVREAALGALARIGSLTDGQVWAAFADPAPVVRRRAATLAATRRSVSVLSLLDDTDPTVVEVAAWACGEQERVDEATLTRLIALATDADDALVRESSAAALGAIGDPRGLPAILVAVRDKPNVRRRAVLALAPFEGPEVDAAIEAALIDRDWQVRQAAEDLRRATGELDV
jgi:HEAT repeat protein